MREISIASAYANANDGEAIEQLLDPIPAAGNIRLYLDRPFCGPRYSEDAKTLYIIGSTGEMIVCASIGEISLDEADAVVSAFAETSSGAEFMDRVMVAVDKALPGVTHPVH